MIIRLAKQSDKQQILALQDELLTSVAKTKNQALTHAPVEKVGSELFDKTFNQDIVKYFVAEDNGKIVGLATLVVYPLVRRGVYRAKLEELVVIESMRGKRVGSELFIHVLQYCKYNKIPTLVLSSELGLEQSHKFYEKHGGKFTEKLFKFDIK